MLKQKSLLVGGILLSISLLSGAILSAPFASADSSDTVNIKVKVPAACTLTTTNNNLVKTINPGTSDTVGTANLKAVCNDPDGFAIYAIGYTDNMHGNNYLTTSLGDDYKIPTGTNTSGNTSSWFMTIDNDNVTGNYTATIENSFDNPHIVPDTNTKIATVTSETDQTIGTNLTAKFDAYISPSQAAGTYQGKVKFTLVHPSTHTTPASRPATLDAGSIVNAKMKNLANNASSYDEATRDEKIKSIEMADALPDGFIASDANTISVVGSEYPVYIFFDDTNSAGIMNVYTEGDQVFLNPDSSSLFSCMSNLSDFSDIEDWDTSNVTNMSAMFYSAGHPVTTFSLDLSGWDTSSVTDMSYMFGSAGYSATTWSLNLSYWDTSNVTNMSGMFSSAGYFTSAFSLDLSGWDTSNVTSMNTMFYATGYSANTFSLDLSGWDTSSVTDMNAMLNSAGYSATTFSLNLSGWDTSSVANMNSMFYTTGYSATTFELDLSGWDTSSVTDMSTMFNSVGYSATTFSLNLSGWDTSNVTDMSYMFGFAGYSATTFSLNLSGWDTSSVANMNTMFYSTGYSATTFSLNLSGWDTSNVTDMSYMFGSAGYSATTWSVAIPQTNGDGITNTTSQLFGNSESIYASPDSGRSFTLSL